MARARGNLSIWFFVGGLLIFTVWRWLSGVPGDAQIRLLPLLPPMSVDQLGTLFDVLLGAIGLTAVVSASNFKSLLTHAGRPLAVVTDPELRRCLMAPLTVAISILTLVAAMLAWVAVWVVDLRTVYEVIAELESGTPARFVSEDGAGTQRIRLTGGNPTRLVLGPPGSSAVVVLRDKYGLRPLDAFVVRRTPLGYAITPCVQEGESPSPESTRGSSAAGLAGTGWRDLGVTGELRWSADTVRVSLMAVGHSPIRRAWIRAGDGLDGPEQAEPDHAQRYLEWLFRKREEVAHWVQRPALIAKDGPTVRLPMDSYNLEILFEEATLNCPGRGAVGARTAVRLSAIEQAG